MKKLGIPVSVLVQTLNEQASIARCLSALGRFDEVVVVDSMSMDRTEEIALRRGARVVKFSWNGLYPKKKQWQLDNIELANEWVLLLDADEYPSPQLVDEIEGLATSSGPYVAGDVTLQYAFAGRFLKHGHRVHKIVLVRRGFVSFPEVDDLGVEGMGELEGHYQPIVSGPIRALHAKLMHEDIDPVKSWFDRHNRYSSWEASMRITAENLKIAATKSRQGQLFERIPLKPATFFLYSYLGRLGFLDGRAGFDYAIALSFYYWQIGLKEREALRRRRG